MTLRDRTTRSAAPIEVALASGGAKGTYPNLASERIEVFEVRERQRLAAEPQFLTRHGETAANLRPQCRAISLRAPGVNRPQQG
jgi:hypothetical protein